MVKETLISWKDYACGANSQIYSYLTKKYLKGTIDSDGYIVVSLKCIDGKNRIFRWHRVIWTFFYGTIPQDMQINHIDENKQNNALSNLNLMTPKENCNWGSRNERMTEKQSKTVVAIDDDGNVVHEFASTAEAGRNGFNQSHVAACCKTGGKHKGLHWRYA